jgi:hypothetical protein
MYFVVDVHHRVTLAHQLQMEYIDAEVTAITTSDALTPERGRAPVWGAPSPASTSGTCSAQITTPSTVGACGCGHGFGLGSGEGWAAAGPSDDDRISGVSQCVIVGG